MSMNKTQTSVIISTFNEASKIEGCLNSLDDQTLKNFEVIIVDDSSTDGTKSILRSYLKNNPYNFALKIYFRQHKGSGESRNFGASKAKGKIIVFVDADMYFDKNFLNILINPILKKRTIGTNSKNEFLANPDNYWAKCWSIGRYAAAKIYSDEYLKNINPTKGLFGNVYRAILKSEFNKVKGYEKGGDYSDDMSLRIKLGTQALTVNGAVFYHFNPDTLPELVFRAKWIGEGRNFNENFKKKISSLIKFSPPAAFIKGLIIGLRFRYIPFVLFKIIYDSTIFITVLTKK